MKTFKLAPNRLQAFGGVELPSCNSVSWEHVAEEAILNTDGSAFIGGAYVDNQYYRVTISRSEAPSEAVKPGDTGNLVLYVSPRANGEATLASMTLTFAGAVYTGNTSQVNHGGVSEHGLTFIVPGVQAAGSYTDPLTVTTNTDVFPVV